MTQGWSKRITYDDCLHFLTSHPSWTASVREVLPQIGPWTASNLLATRCTARDIKEQLLTSITGTLFLPRSSPRFAELWNCMLPECSSQSRWNLS